MEFPDPRHPPRLLKLPRPSLVDDFFAPHARPRALSGARAPALLNPGSHLTGRPALDSRPIGTPELAQAQFFIVKLADGRPGLVLAADHTKVWTPPRVPNRQLRPAVATAPARPEATVSYTPQWWTNFLEAIRPKAGFILYAEDSALPNAPYPGQFLRQGHVYGALDITVLKKAMDMSTSKWEVAEGPSKWFNKLMDLGPYRFKNMLGVHDGIEAAVMVKEQLLEKPEVKVVVYSGHKTTPTEVERIRQASGPAGTVTGGAGYQRITTRDGAAYDSLWQSNFYDKHGRSLGHLVARPSR